MAAGLSAGQAAKAVGVPRATLYRWEKRPDRKSRRPQRPRKPRHTSFQAQGVEQARRRYPMWGKRKIAVPLRCKIRDLRFPALPDDITACHSSLGGEFGEGIDVVKDASNILQVRYTGLACMLAPAPPVP